MAFQLDTVVPWGRNLQEYKRMFQLSAYDMTKKIAGFGDGPASFNCEATRLGYSVTSFDPVYHFSKAHLQKRIEEVRIMVMQQMRENQDNYVWTQIHNLEELEATRMSAMQMFLEDFEQGKQEQRYICHALPEKLDLQENTFDIGLSSHFLLMYTALGYEFHIRAITEMLRVCREVRIFPVVDLNASRSGVIADVVAYFQKNYQVEFVETQYVFQKGENLLLVIRK